MMNRCSTLVTIAEIPEDYKFLGQFLDFEVVCAPLRPSDLNKCSTRFRCHANIFDDSALHANATTSTDASLSSVMSMSAINVPCCKKREFGSPGTAVKSRPLTSLSQPCLPVCVQGPTKILPFLYLGSQQDAMDQETLKKYGIDYVLNLSTSCPKPDHLQDEHFLRIPVQDSYTEELLPYFEEAFQFLDKVREASGVALIHCLAGISRSPTLAIAYVMQYLHMSQDEAYRYVKEKRPSISPNFNFLGQLLEYEQLLSFSTYSRKASISLKSPPLKSAKSSPSVTGSRSLFQLPKYTLYPVLTEQSPESCPKATDESKSCLDRISNKDAQEIEPFTYEHESRMNSENYQESKITEHFVERERCTLADCWPLDRRMETEILCRSHDDRSCVDVQSMANRNSLDLGLDKLASSKIPLHFASKPLGLQQTAELPSPSTELSKLNFDSKRAISSLRATSESTDAKKPNGKLICSNRSSEETSKVNPLFMTDYPPIPPGRRRKRTMTEHQTAPMDCQEAGPSSVCRANDSNTTIHNCNIDESSKNDRCTIAVYPFIDSWTANQNSVNSAYAANPLFSGEFSPDWQTAFKPKTSLSCPSEERNPFKQSLKVRSRGSTLTRKFIQNPLERKSALNTDLERNRRNSSVTKHPKFSELSRKFQDFLKSSRLHFSSLTNSRQGFMEPSSSLDCLSSSPTTSQTKLEEFSGAPMKSQSTYLIVENEQPSFGINCAENLTKYKFLDNAKNNVTPSSSSSSSVNYLTSPSFSGPKFDNQNSTSRRCSSASLSKHSEIHDCSENMGSSSSLEIAVN